MRRLHRAAAERWARYRLDYPDLREAAWQGVLCAIAAGSLAVHGAEFVQALRGRRHWSGWRRLVGGTR